jgi:hypothetical protein
MKAIQVVFVALAAVLVCAGLAMGDAGSPDNMLTRTGEPTTVLITGIGEVGFQGDGSVEIPFTLEGSPATVYLSVYTKGKGAALGTIISGAMDCLTTNKIDVLVYVSGGQWFEEGANSIVWNGKNTDGNAVTQEDYTYYLTAINEKDEPTWVGIGGPGAVEIMTKDASGPIDPPIFLTGGMNDEMGPNNQFVARSTAGTDWLTTPEAYENFDVLEPSNTSMGLAVDPENIDVLYVPIGGWSCPVPWAGVLKCTIEGEELVADEDFGEDGVAFGDIMTTKYVFDNVRILEDKIYVGWNNRNGEPQSSAVIVADKATGELETMIDIPLFVNDGAAYGPSGMDVNETGIYLVGHGSPYVIKLDFDGVIEWINGNGDGYNDKQYEDGTYTNGDYGPGVYSYDIAPDKYGFSYLSMCGGAAMSSCLGPDGTGLFFISPELTPLTEAITCRSDSVGQQDGDHQGRGGCRRGGSALEALEVRSVSSLSESVQPQHDHRVHAGGAGVHHGQGVQYVGAVDCDAGG